MRTLTATQVSRNFAAVLDDVAEGQTVVITRGGRELAVISPMHRANGRDVKELLAALPRDDGFWNAVESSHAELNRPWSPTA